MTETGRLRENTELHSQGCVQPTDWCFNDLNSLMGVRMREKGIEDVCLTGSENIPKTQDHTQGKNYQ